MLLKRVKIEIILLLTMMILLGKCYKKSPTEHDQKNENTNKYKIFLALSPDTLWSSIGMKEWFDIYLTDSLAEGLNRKYIIADTLFTSLSSDIAEIDDHGIITPKNFGLTAAVVSLLDSSGNQISCDTAYIAVIWERVYYIPDEDIVRYPRGITQIAWNKVTNTFYAGTMNCADESGFALISIDEGNHWMMSDNGLDKKYLCVESITSSALNPDLLFIGISNENDALNKSYIYKSSNNGESWQKVEIDGTDGGPVYPVLFSQNHAGYVYTIHKKHAAERTLYLSQDEGITWNKIFTLEGWSAITSILISPDNPDHIYVDNNRSLDGGEHWDKISNVVICISPDGTLYSTIYPEFRKTYIVKSTDQGNTWHAIDRYFSSSLTSMAVHPLDSDNMAVGTYDGQLLVSHDGGVTWKPVPGNFYIYDCYISSMIVLNNTENRLLVGTRIHASVGGNGIWVYQPLN